MRKEDRSILFGFLAVLCLAPVALADPRPFAFTYDTYPEGKGNWEYEQYITYRHGKEIDSGYDRFDFSHEFEFGLADNFDVAIYVANWKWENSDDFSGTRFSSAGAEGIFYLSNPITDFIGSGLYAEVLVGEHEVEFEQKILLQKDINDFIFAYNLIFETEIEGIGDLDEENEIEGVLGHAAGVSYALARDWRVGGEVTAESVFDDWSEYEHTAVYSGPTVQYVSGGDWWVTVTPAVQLTDVEDEADLKVRLIAGVEF